LKLKFNDITLVLTYIQTKINEQYNPNIIIDNKYYKFFNNNYGMAHFIAKYLNDMYPPMSNSYDTELPDDVFNKQRTFSDDISIMNYFLCDNKGNKLQNDLINSNTDEDSLFRDIYGRNICSIFNVDDPPLMTSYTELKAWDLNVNPPGGTTTNSTLKSLVNKIEILGYEDRINQTAKRERIYSLPEWRTEKGICEIDDLVMSYLLGRTITPDSSMEDIYYVQQLLIGYGIQNSDKGIWDSESGNLTEILINYQKTHTDSYSTHPLFPTGYFDIFTEASILKERGEVSNGIYGL
jgi:hypothetical protein